MSKRKTDKEFQKEVKQLVGEEYTFVESYINNKEKILCRHNKCNHEWKVRPNSFLQGTGCPRCAGVKRKTNEEFKKEVYDLVGDKYTFLEKYKSAHEKIRCRHNKCGLEWRITPTAFLKGRRCPACYQNFNMNDRIESIFKENDLEYEVEYLIEIPGDKKNLKFDFAVFKNQELVLLVEYDGLQHFEPTGYFKGEKTLKMTKLKDRIKSAYCYENDIPLLRISYFKREFVEEMIEGKLKEIGVKGVEVNA